MMGLIAEKGYRAVTLEAHDLVMGDREQSYGHPLDDFTCTALMWTAYLRHRGLILDDAAIEAEDVGPLMVLVKMSRQANAPKRDNLVDSAGYCETTARVIFERAKREASLEEFTGMLKEHFAKEKAAVKLEVAVNGTLPVGKAAGTHEMFYPERTNTFAIPGGNVDYKVDY
jgi:Domain of unknown function (DUF6378)